MQISLLNVREAYLELKAELDQAVARVLDSGWYILGREVEAFEGEFAAFCGAQHAVGMANGLDALHLALLALGVKPGDEVIVPSNTFIATWLAVSQCGAMPVPVEPDERTYNIDPSRIEDAITERTRESFCRCTSTASLLILIPSSPSPKSMAFMCWRTPPKRMARVTRAAGSAPTATPSPGAFIRPRTLAP